MRSLKTIFAAALIGAATPALNITAALAQTCSCPVSDEGGPAPRASRAVEVYADEAPPPLPDYEQPPLPAPGYLWTPGYWAWNNYEYYWVPGTWVQPPRVGYLWTPGYWGYADGEYAFHRGYWGERIGFYGGVSYGYGYYGSGFQGGRWDGDHFYYNSTVNNFGSVNVTNVYEQPAPRVVERASFNGGPDGVRARPTAAEIAVAKQPHIAPTADQRQNARVASRTESAFVSSNNGKPPVAATAKPGDLKGSSVVAAKAAGGPLPEKKPETPLPASNKPEGGGKPLLENAPAAKGEPANGEQPERRKKEEAARPAPDAASAPNDEKPKTDRERRKPGDAKPADLKLKTESEPGNPDQPKSERPKVERERPKPGDLDAKPERPKSELERPKPEAERPRPEAERPRPEAERPRPEAERPRPEAERPRPEAERPRPEAERPRPEAERPRPEAERRPEGPGPQAERPRPPGPREGPKCHPGAPDCPK